MKNVVDYKISAKKRREEKRSRNAVNNDYAQKSLTVGTPYKTKFTDPGKILIDS